MRKFTNACIKLLFFVALAPSLLFAQGTQVEFGKNRVQYHRYFDEWSKYESDNFITYWYGEARLVGQSVVQIAEQDFEYIQNILEHRINDKLQIIVYTDLTDLKQSNIGIEEAFTNTSDQTKIVGNKIFVYFNGDHTHLRRQIREGIASVYLDAMLFGSNLQEIVQNAVLLNLPEWFMRGLVSYASEPWSSELDNQLRDIMLAPNFKGFENLAEQHPKLAGHALWYFIGENFGRPMVSNLLYLTRINRSIESGFLYVLGSSYEVVIESWEQYFQQRYRAEVKNKNAPENQELAIRNRRNLPYTRIALSPNGQQLLYITNEIGRYRVFLYDLRTNKKKVIFRGSFRNPFQATDYNYPIVAWNPNGQEIAILYEIRDQPKLLLMEAASGKRKEEPLSTEYQRVYSMDYVNPFQLVFSASVRGQSDIFIYYTKTRQSERITQDFWDDLDAAAVQIGGKRGIVFASNRQDTLLQTARLDSILPIQSFDLFYYDLEEKNKELVRLTHTPFANERQPGAVDSTYVTFLSDETGIYNRQVAYLEKYLHHYDQVITLTDGTEIVLHQDSSLSSLDTSLIDTIVLRPVIKQRAIESFTTNMDRNMLRQSLAPRAGKLAELVFREGRHHIYVGNLNLDTLTRPTPTIYRLKRDIPIRLTFHPERDIQPEPAPALPGKAGKLKPGGLPPTDSATVVEEAYLFQVDFPDLPAIAEEAEETEPEKPEVAEEEPPQEIALLRGVQPARIVETAENQEVYRFQPARIVAYRSEFHTDFVTTKLDNSLLFEGLEPYDANQDVFTYPPPGILFKANFKDLFEDHELEGGMRVPTTFDGTEFFMVYRNKKHRLDRTFALYRQNQRLAQTSRSIIPNVPNRRDVNSLLGMFTVRYPLDIFRSLRATALFRRDRNIQLATERPTLETPTEAEQRVGLRLEYVFDNTLDVSMNIKNGARYKIYGMMMKKFDLQVFDGFNLDFNRGFMSILGADVRHYQRLLKFSVLATRIAAATSFGSERMLYFLGGVDNWLFPSQNQDIPFPENSDEFAFKALAAPMRGFDINIRNGSSFAVANAELRMPVFRYLFPRTRSSLLRNLQAVGFFDVGTAWEGATPFSDDNPLNTSVIQNSDLVEVKVNFFRDPVVAGYGIGARALLFGYFIRLDYAWGIETRRVQDPKLFLSLGLDF